MKYACLIYDDEKLFDAMPKPEVDAILGEYFALSDELGQSGHLLGGEALLPVSSATVVRVRNGRVSTTDGPYAETKEQLGGFFLIEARDLDEAIRIAARIPSARLGSIEVRPVMEFER
ncbi:MAG TPA: YciI family protein [Lysobacter sp.]